MYDTVKKKSKGSLTFLGIKDCSEKNLIKRISFDRLFFQYILAYTVHDATGCYPWFARLSDEPKRKKKHSPFETISKNKSYSTHQCSPCPHCSRTVWHPAPWMKPASARASPLPFPLSTSPASSLGNASECCAQPG